MEETGNVIAFPQAPDAVELRHLRAFVAVAEELNFGRAADRLHISQPALSRQVRSLEQLVGTELLRRSTHNVELTLAGEALLDRARKLLSDIDEAVAAAQSVGGELIARVARLWEPITDEATTDANLQAMRDAYEQLLAQFPVPDGMQVRPVNAGGVNSLVVSAEPAEPPTIILLHGGGFVLGSAFGYRPLAGALGAAAGTGVLVPDFRLAPEHPHPAALDDALAAYSWLLEQGVDPGTVAVCGDSAGGGLAMALLLALKDRGLPLPGGGILFCPAVDIEGNLQDPDDPRHVMSFEVTSRFTKAYLADHPADDPILSPLYADLTGLAPALDPGRVRRPRDRRRPGAREACAQARRLLAARGLSRSRPTSSSCSGRSCPRRRTPSRRRERLRETSASRPISSSRRTRPAPSSAGGVTSLG